jgi:hypothetical protein
MTGPDLPISFPIRPSGKETPPYHA